MLHADPIHRSLLVSTRNAHKVEEIREILGPRFRISDLSALPGFPEVEETGSTFQENAAIKALAASARFEGWVIADDSGLEVDALNGAPGVRSARFSGESATDASNRALLLAKLLTVRGQARSARFRCVIALAREGKVLASFSGSVEGQHFVGINEASSLKVSNFCKIARLLAFMMRPCRGVRMSVQGLEPPQ